MAPSVTCFVRGSDVLGECPVWDDRSCVLRWVDIGAPALKRCDASGSDVRALPLPEPAGSYALRESSAGLLAAMRSGLYFLDPDTGERRLLARPEADLPGNRFNDGRCDRAGRFWAGTMSLDERTPSGSLYRVDPDGRCARVRSGVTIPNSIAWSPDGRTLYFADTPRLRIWALECDPGTGAVVGERVFAESPGAGGGPDGSCVDADGCLWNAEYGRARLVRYTPRGRIDRVVAMPVSNPTCCCFGGTRLDTLFVTSAAQRLDAAELARQPLAGSVLALVPGVLGLPESRFAG
ncbi:MAG TPA: SMP-30/gluconolactonase/LRE family protein [Burkholderiales bacterium]|nr:SMP-30/gluconolactonase/LRE family protein [Burkholderiales bacterium]